MIPRPIGHLAYRVAYIGLQLWSLIARPHTRGVKCLLTAGDEILLVRHSYGPRRWELPGGFVRRDESFSDAARRELGEELGIDGALGTYTDLGELQRVLGGRHETVGLYRVALPAPMGAIQGFELIRIGWYRRDALPPRQSPLLEEVLQRDRRFA